MVCWLSSFFLSIVSKVFYIKACYCLPSSLRHMLRSSHHSSSSSSSFCTRWLEIKIEALPLCWFFLFFFFFKDMQWDFLLTSSLLLFFFFFNFGFAAQFPWSLGFDIKLYTDVLIEVFAFIWWLCISLIATFLQWRMPSCCYIPFLQQ